MALLGGTPAFSFAQESGACNQFYDGCNKAAGYVCKLQPPLDAGICVKKILPEWYSVFASWRMKPNNPAQPTTICLKDWLGRCIERVMVTKQNPKDLLLNQQPCIPQKKSENSPKTGGNVCAYPDSCNAYGQRPGGSTFDSQACKDDRVAVDLDKC